MSKRQLDIADDFRKEFHKRADFLSKSLSIIRPITEEDKRLLQVGMDMLSSLDEELQRAETLRDFAEILDVEKLEANWEDVKKVADQRASQMADEFHFGDPKSRF